MKKEEELEAPNAGHMPEAFPDCSARRVARGIDLKDLSHETRIRVSYLEAIEKGDFEKLPEPIYAQTFIKTYAAVVGIDAAALLAHYRAYLEKAHPQALHEPSARRKELPLSDLKPRDAFFKIPLKTLGWIFAIVIVIGFLISFFSTHMNSDERPEWIQQPLTQPAPAPSQATAPAAVPGEAAPPAAVTGGSIPAAPPTAVPAPTVYKLVIEATDTSWVNVMEDDNPPYEVLLRAGERIEREASKKFTIDLGNAGGVMITFQGKSLGRLGQKGQVMHLTLPESAQQ